MRKKYENELRTLNSQLVSMGKMIEVAIESSILALMGRDCKSAEELIKNDDLIDSKEREIENLCVKLLLQQQPVASDLRVITSALKMVTDMERIGDHASDIASLIVQLPDIKFCKMNLMSEMSNEILQMLHDSIDSYIARDYEKAKNVIANDDIIDRLYGKLKHDLVEKIKTSDQGEMIIDYLLIAKYLERIGDHATNIAEWAIYSITGELK